MLKKDLSWGDILGSILLIVGFIVIIDQLIRIFFSQDITPSINHFNFMDIALGFTMMVLGRYILKK